MNRAQEIALVVQAKQDIRYFASLYDIYYDKILTIAFRRTFDQQVSEDITADTFERAIRSLSSFEDQGFGFSAWLYRIANNCIADHFRRKAKENLVTLDDLDTVLVDPCSLQNTVENDDYQQYVSSEVSRLLLQLDEDEQLIMTLKYLDQKRNTEIARIMKYSANNVGVIIHRCLGKMRSLCDQTIEVSHA